MRTHKQVSRSGPALGLGLLLLGFSCGSPPAPRPAVAPEAVVLVTAETGPSARQQRLAAMAPTATAQSAGSERLRQALMAFHERTQHRRGYIAVDKPLYRPGETIWFRAFDLRSADFTGDAKQAGMLFQLVSPKGAVVREKRARLQKGHAASDFVLPGHVPGGEYIIKATSQRGLEVERPVIVSSYQPPRIKKKLEFLRKAYGPGDQVAAAVALSRATGELFAGREVVGQVTLDGSELMRVPVTTDGEGKAVVRFQLPAQMVRGDGLLTVLVEDGGVTESIQKRIPITLDRLQLALYPEGGDLVAGLPARVYFSAKNLIDKPADVEGRVVDDRSQVVALLRSHYNGMGRFEFTPLAGRSYRVEISRPVGITSTFELPAARASGCAMQAVDDIESARDDVRVAVWCTRATEVVASAVLRERLLAAVTADVPAGSPAVLSLPTPDNSQGAVRVTLFDRDLTPMSERLVYRKRGADLQVKVTSDRESYQPRDRVTLTVETRGADDKPVPADLALTVVDDTVLSFADDKTAHMLARLYLESEMPTQEIEEPNFYFSDDPRAPAGLDMVLGTQGWRRFDWKPVFAKPPAPPITETWAYEGEYWRGEDGERAPKEPMADDDDDDDDGVADDREREIFRRGPQPEPPPAPEAVAERPAPAKVEEAKQRPARVVKKPPPARRPARKPARRRPARPKPPPAAEPMAAAEAEPEPMAAGAMMRRELADDEDFGGEELVIVEDEIAVAGQVGPAVDWMPEKRRIRDADWGDGPARGPVPWTFSPVRVFPTPNYAARYDGPRVDFRETIFWAPQLLTDEQGKASVQFYLSDAVTSFRAQAEGVSQSGALGRGDALVRSKLPVSLAVKMPLEVTAGDIVRLPITVANETRAPQQAKLSATFGKAFQVAGTALPGELQLQPGERKSFFQELTVTGTGQNPADGAARVTIETSNLRDQVERTIRVVPLGFPQEVSLAGTVAERARHELALSDVLPGTLDARLTFYPSPLATMLEGTEAIIREPTGCFEQASSANYPNVMVLAYLEEHGSAQPELVQRTHGMLERGYRKLTGYESPEKGYEWFGGDPGHEALTAYGLMEFHDMTRVYQQVDRDMIERTASWLKKRRDGKGGYQRNKRALDSFGRASDQVTDAYITYALAKVGTKNLDKELARQVEMTRSTKDPYIMALATGTLLYRDSGDRQAGVAAKKLAGMQDESGAFTGADHSITRSGGAALTIETTSLAALALMRAGDSYMPNVRKAIDWLNKNRSGFGGYGSTQSTVLTLEAMNTYAARSRRTRASGVVQVRMRGDQVAERAYAKGHEGPLEIDLAPFVRPGQDTLEIGLRSEQPLPYSVAITYNSTVPSSSPETKVSLVTRLARAEVPMGESVRMDVRLENVTDDGVPMTLARVGLPGGLTFQTWQLKELRDKKLIDFYETREREVILYFRALPPKAVKEVPLELVARVPGTYTAPASRAYLYYTDEHKHWVAPERITVTH